MYCNKCGSPVNDSDEFCRKCGVRRKAESAKPIAPPVEEDASIGWGVLGFFFPVIGMALCLFWRDEHRKRSTMAGKGAAVVAVLETVVVAVYIIVYFISLIVLVTSPKIY